MKGGAKVVSWHQNCKIGRDLACYAPPPPPPATEFDKGKRFVKVLIMVHPVGLRRRRVIFEVLEKVGGNFIVVVVV